MNYFFDGMPPQVVPAKGRGRAKEPARDDLELMGKRETLSLVRSYYKIEDADVRQRVYEFTKAVAASAGKGS